MSGKKPGFPPIGPDSTWNGGEHRGVWYITEYINAVNEFTSRVVYANRDAPDE